MSDPIDLEYLKRKIHRKARGGVRGVDISACTRLDDIGLSSLQIAEIVFEIEEEKGVEFDVRRASEAKTLGNLIEMANESIAEGSVS